jgi:carboxyl-terminal processing protease
MTVRRLLAVLLLLTTFALAAQEPTPNAIYNEACVLALAGKKEEAFAKLQEAVKRGWVNFEHAERDTDLTSLRDDPRWQPLIEKMKTLTAADRKRWANPTLVTPYRENLSEEEKIAGLSRVWSEVRYNFANFDLIPDVDWDALYLAAIPRVRATKSTLEYYNVLIELVAKLRDGHTGAWPPKDLQDRVWAIPAMRQRMIDGRIMVTAVGEGAPVNVGDEILEVDGRPWKEHAAAHVIPYLSASTPQDLDNRTGTNLLEGAAGTNATLKVRDAGGAMRTVQVERQSLAKRMPSISAPFEFRMLRDDVAYIALNDFSNDTAADEYDKHYDQIAKARALVIDLRNNGGGNTSVGYRVLATLIDTATGTTQGQKMVYRPTDRARGQLQRLEFEESSIRPDPKGRHFTKPVAVLIGPATYSAAEDFMVAWKLTKRGPSLGTATGGSTGQPLIVALPGGGGVRICTKRDRFITGDEFVGTGIKPDIEVRTKFEDAQQGRDPVLERAVAEVLR